MKISKTKELQLYNAVFSEIDQARGEIAKMLKQAHNGNDIDEILSKLLKSAPLAAVSCFKGGIAPKKEPDYPEYADFVRVWCDNCPEIGVQMPKDGAKIKSLILQTRSYLKNAGQEVTPEKAAFFWEAFCKKLRDTWAFGKTLSVIDSNYPAIIFEMKNGKRKDNYNSRTSTQRAVDNL